MTVIPLWTAGRQVNVWELACENDSFRLVPISRPVIGDLRPRCLDVELSCCISGRSGQNKSPGFNARRFPKMTISDLCVLPKPAPTMYAGPQYPRPGSMRVPGSKPTKSDRHGADRLPISARIWPGFTGT